MASENGRRTMPPAAGLGATWSIDEVCNYLKEHDVSGDIVDRFLEYRIGLRELSLIDEGKLRDIGIEAPNDHTVLELLKVFFQNASTYKIFNDPIHGHIKINDLLLSIIDTPEFQRLRWIKQLGICCFVYPGATHTRFEHSLGVAHIAGEFVRTLRINQPELDITDEDVLCVEIAGLCHDLGHGPFSHTFDAKFMRAFEDEWKHENASIAMFEHLVKKNELKTKFAKHRIDENDVKFIKELIKGLKLTEAPVGRPENKRFLYDIVANKRTGIDVDKWDYFARDCYYLGINKTFDYKRFMHFCRVINKEICCRDKEAKNLCDMFMSRANLHRMAYQHKTYQSMENMLVEALRKADDHYLKFAGSDGTKYKMSKCWLDMEAYSKLTDHIFFDILSSSENELVPAREVLLRIQCRKLYQLIGETRPIEDDSKYGADCIDDIAKQCKSKTQEWWKEQLVGQIVKLDFGNDEINPIKNMSFYSKNEPTVKFEMDMSDVSIMLPKPLMEVRYRLYCKSTDPSVHRDAALGFIKWCKEPKLFVDITAP